MLAAVRWNENGWKTDDSLQELARLAETAQLEVVGSVTQTLDHPHPQHYLGKGKVAEVNVRLRRAIFGLWALCQLVFIAVVAS